MVEESNQPAHVQDDTVDRSERPSFCAETDTVESSGVKSDDRAVEVVSHVECCVCKGGYDHPKAATLALSNGWMRDGTAWVCPGRFVSRR